MTSGGHWHQTDMSPFSPLSASFIRTPLSESRRDQRQARRPDWSSLVLRLHHKVNSEPIQYSKPQTGSNA
jgi:hypothetical protein